MPCTPEDLLELAKELSESTNETKLRASIGRSYYCAFHHCLKDRQITDTRTWVGGSGGVHQKLIEEYIYDDDKSVGYMLQNLKTKRHLADYELSGDINQGDAQATLECVTQLLIRISNQAG